ncbi:MAG: divalent-cation tolerance protein CutA [Terrimicrobiaceae bacterium]
MADNNTLCLVLTTFAEESSAAKVVRQLVEERLAACGTLLPQARSIYRWKDQIEDTRETVVLFKTTSHIFHEFQSRLLYLHPYETPEILAWEPSASQSSYAAWVMESVGQPIDRHDQ